VVDDVHRPLAVYRFRLTTADALTYERLPGEWTGWQKAAFILPLLAIGALAGFLEDWVGIWWWGAVGGLLLVWAVVGLFIFNWRIHRRAKVRAAAEGQTEVEEWGDHLTIRSQAGETHIANEVIGKVIVSDHHVFVLYPGGALILPQRAFESPQAMRIFGEAIDRRSMDAAP
jgi:hypothetical protein